MPQTKMITALREAFDEELERDERVCLFGEDVGKQGGVFSTSVKLQRKYGAHRVFDTPLSEAAIVGTAVGAAMAGLRPIAEIMYVDFITVAMDPLINQAAKLRYMSNGQLKIPLVIFAQCGIGTAEAAQHSQFLEAWFAHTPGLKVVMPSTVCDAKGLLKASIRDDNPVVFLWHRMMYNFIEEVPEGECLVPLGEAVVRREGADMTVVCTSMMVPKVLEVADSLAGEISLEVVDPRTISPLDMDTILKSVAKTGRLLVVHEANTHFGIGAEIVRRVCEEAFEQLKSPPIVLGGANLPIPFSPVLENVCVPRCEDIAAAVRRTGYNNL